MLPLESGDVADERARVGVHHFDGAAARQVDAAGRWIHRDVIEIFHGAARRGGKLVRFQKVIAAIGAGERQAGSHEQDGDCCEGTFSKKLHRDLLRK